MSRMTHFFVGTFHGLTPLFANLGHFCAVLCIFLRCFSSCQCLHITVRATNSYVQGTTQIFLVEKIPLCHFGPLQFLHYLLAANHLTLTQLYFTKHTLPHKVTVENQNEFHNPLPTFNLSVETQASLRRGFLPQYFAQYCIFLSATYLESLPRE